jgi:hypothetical protein
MSHFSIIKIENVTPTETSPANLDGDFLVQYADSKFELKI